MTASGQYLRQCDVWETEGGRLYYIVAHNPEFSDFPFTARYMEPGFRYGMPVAFNKDGVSQEGSARLVKLVEREL